MKLTIKIMLLSLLLVIIPGIILSTIGFSTTKTAVDKGIESRLLDQSSQIALDTKTVYNIAQMKVKSDLGLAKQIFYEYGKPTIDDTGNMVLIDETKNELVQKKVNSDLMVAHSMLYALGNPVIDSSKTIPFEATNQITKEKKNLTIPVMTLAGVQLAKNYDFVDKVKATSGVETCTIFQVIPDGILRITTNVMKEDNTRAVGTYIPKDSPVYKAVMNKQTYRGSAYVVTAWYQTGYEPILDDGGNVIGVLYVGAKEAKQTVNNNFDTVEKITKISGSTATVFQLKNYEGQKENDVTSKDWPYDQAMYRISTTVKKLDGSRAIGTMVAKNVYDAIMRGESYYGRAFVVTENYLTAYEPIIDYKTNKTIGILYVGIKEKEFQDEILNNLAKQVIGVTGYIYVLDSKGNYILSKNHERDGENIIETKDSKGEYVMKNIIDKAKSLPEGKSSIISYEWSNAGEPAKKKIVGFSYMKEWDWVIGVGANYEDYKESETLLKNSMVVLLVVIIVGAGIALLLSNAIVNPLKKLTNAGREISNGKLDTPLPEITTKDEIQDLGDTMTLLIGALKFLKEEAGKKK